MAYSELEKYFKQLKQWCHNKKDLCECLRTAQQGQTSEDALGNNRGEKKRWFRLGYKQWKWLETIGF